MLHRRGLRFLVDTPPLCTDRRRRLTSFSGSAHRRLRRWLSLALLPEHAHLPKSNREQGRHTLGRVLRRDRDTDAELTAAEWLIIRGWEHEGPEAAADRIVRLARERRTCPRPERGTQPKPATRLDRDEPRRVLRRKPPRVGGLRTHPGLELRLP